MPEIQIIDSSSDTQWDSVLSESSLYDFYHTSYFHNIDSDYPSKLFVVRYKNSFIALPHVLRPVPDTPFFDITSVYGYAGPVFNFDNTDSKEKLQDFFRETFKEYCTENSVISVFSRLHPLIDQREIVHDLGEVKNLNQTVSVNVQLDPAQQRKAYRKSLKSELNQLRRSGMIVEKAETREDIDHFIAIYYETMERVKAAKKYFFSPEYFYKFLTADSFSSTLLLAKRKQEVIAGAIFTETGKIMQYHLAGTTAGSMKETPMKLIIDEARLLATQKQLSYLHLGGGVGGSDEDSLFRFKSAFSKVFHQFAVWRYIHNPSVYEQLSAELANPNREFFPAYRNN